MHTLHIPQQLQPPDRHIAPSELPELIMAYLHLLFNLFVLLLAIVGISAFAYTLVRDIERKTYAVVEQLSSQSLACSRAYAANRCADVRTPLTEEACDTWLACMRADPAHIGRIKIAAMACADIMEGFAGELGWRGLLLCAACVAGLWVGRGGLVPTFLRSDHLGPRMKLPRSSRAHTPDPVQLSHAELKHQRLLRHR